LQENIMTVEEVMQYRRAVPFKPFVLVLKDGRRFEVLRPEAVGRNESYTRIMVADEESGEDFDGALISHVEPIHLSQPLSGGHA
jgi:hypothetical protein